MNKEKMIQLCFYCFVIQVRRFVSSTTVFVFHVRWSLFQVCSVCSRREIL